MSLPSTICGYLDRAAKLDDPEADIIFVDRHEGERKFGFPEIHRRVQQSAGTLFARGVRPGDRVAIVLPTSPLFLDAFLGAQWLGAIPVPLYPPVRLGRLGEYFDRTVAMMKGVDAQAIIADARVRRVLGEVVARVAPPLGLIKAEDLKEGSALALHSDDHADRLAMVQFSSGTTVDPKPVGLTHRQVLANAESILDFLPPNPADQHVGVSWLPLYHDMGLIGCVIPAIHRPGRLVLIPPEVFLARPAIWLRTISRHRAIISPAPNFAFGVCAVKIKESEMDGVDLSSWKMALNGAEPVSPKTMAAFGRRFSTWGFDERAMMPVYGLSEAALAVTFSPMGRGVQSRRFERRSLGEGRAVPSESGEDGVEIVSVGRSLRGFSVEIRPAESTGPSEAGCIGRIWVAGPSLMEGYIDRDASPIQDGWLDTGDEGFLLDGELFVTGRAKDVIVIRGQNHCPHEIEAVLDDVDGVRKGCSVAVGSVEDEGEVLLVFVEVKDDAGEIAEACRRAILVATGLNPALVVLLAPGTMPRTSSGKLRRQETLKRWKRDTLLPGVPVTPWRMAGVMAKSFWASRKGGR